MYVAVKGGEAAILQSHQRLREQRRGSPALAELGVAQIRQQLKLAVDRVMCEGSLHDPELAALAIKQASGDLVEAIFLLRAFRATLPRLGATRPVATDRMHLSRRISATFKDLPGGQMLGATADYTQRLLDFSLLDGEEAGEDAGNASGLDPSASIATTAAANGPMASATNRDARSSAGVVPSVVGLLDAQGLVETSGPACDEHDTQVPPVDLTREPMHFPAARATRLQNLARGDEGFLLAMAYSTQRGYAHSHPFVGEIRVGRVAIEIDCEDVDFCLSIGEIEITECQMLNQFTGSRSAPPQFTRGYGLAFGHNERKAMAMSLVDRALRADELGETVASPAQMQEFVLSHSDSLEASGFVQHLKLPHYVDFQAELELVRRMRESALARSPDDA